MYLASLQEIRESLGFDQMPDIDAAISMALNTAEPQIASLLNTDFARQDVVDLFWVREPTVTDGSHCNTEFRLSQGLLLQAPVVKRASSVAELDVGQDVSTAMHVDLGRGVLTDVGTRWSSEYVQVSYTSGFEADPDDENSYKVDQVPKWLREAAVLKTMYQLVDHPTLTEAGVRLDGGALDRQFTSLINRHLRYAPAALLPL